MGPKEESVAVIETVLTEQAQLDQVPLAHIIGEGDGHATVAQRKTDHEHVCQSGDVHSYPVESVRQYLMWKLSRYRLNRQRLRG
jgi:uncharacterized protein YhfF